MSDIQTPVEGTELETTTPPATPEPGQEPETSNATALQTPPVEPTESKPVQPAPVVPKEKFVASQRESILNAARVDVANTRIEQLTKTDTPTDEAMRKLYPEWDQLDDYNKKVLIRQETIAMQQTATIAKQQEIDARQRLEDQLDSVIDDSEFSPKLKGKETEFKRFARNPKNRGIDASTLAKAFLFDAQDETSPTPSTPMKEALPAGSGGPRGDLTPKKISVEEAAEIRKTDYRRYMELVKTGQIEDI